MRLKLWGVRGSLPSPISPENLNLRFENLLDQYAKFYSMNPDLTPSSFLSSLPQYQVGGYGGHTTCAEICTHKTRLIIDAGSGIQALSQHLMATDPTITDYHIYITHFHWDHLIGLSFFVPMYIPGKNIHFYGVHRELEPMIRSLFKKPNFPVPFDSLASKSFFHIMPPREEFQIGDLKLKAYSLDHPDPCWGLRIEHENKSIAWCVDNEAIRTSAEELGEDNQLYHNADLMIFDAQYSFSEGLTRINWGHSNGPIGLDIAIRENIKKVLFVHHDPSASDEAIHKAEQQTQAYYQAICKERKLMKMPSPQVQWKFGVEGESVDLNHL